MSDKIFKPVFQLKRLFILFLVINVIGLQAQVNSKFVKSARIVSRMVSIDAPHFYGSIYVQKTGFNLRSGEFVSGDNGRSWSRHVMATSFPTVLPTGYRRDPVTSVLDTNAGSIIKLFNALDVINLDPKINEPPIALKAYYLRYRVSSESGNAWLSDKQIIQEGNFSAAHPFPGIYIGKNSIYLGDKGSIPIITKNGKIIVPAHTTLLGRQGELLNPGNGHTYTSVVALIGTWVGDHNITWKMSQRIEGDPSRSTRGMIEPTILELKDGRLLMVMRGSNEKTGDTAFRLPSYKWKSVSQDGGASWTVPVPFTFDDGMPFYSPSSMSTLFRHSSGRCFWVGNITKNNSRGDLPRFPLVFAEVNTSKLALNRNSIVVVDTLQPEDSTRGRLDISHVSLLEDRQSKEIILTYPRSYNAYKSNDWITVRIAVN